MMAMPECQALLETAKSVATYGRSLKRKTAAESPSSAITGLLVREEINLGAFGLTVLTIDTSGEGNETLQLVCQDVGVFSDATALKRGFNILKTVRHRDLINPVAFNGAKVPILKLLYTKPASFPRLSHHLRVASSGVPPEHRLSVLLSIAEATEYLHTRSIVHGLISPETVIVDDLFTAKLLLASAGNLLSEPLDDGQVSIGLFHDALHAVPFAVCLGSRHYFPRANLIRVVPHERGTTSERNSR